MDLKGPRKNQSKSALHLKCTWLWATSFQCQEAQGGSMQGGQDGHDGGALEPSPWCHGDHIPMIGWIPMLDDQKIPHPEGHSSGNMMEIMMEK